MVHDIILYLRGGEIQMSKQKLKNSHRQRDSGLNHRHNLNDYNEAIYVAKKDKTLKFLGILFIAMGICKLCIYFVMKRRESYADRKPNQTDNRNQKI